MVKIVEARLVLGMLRDQGYKNSSYAIGELVDNSIDAGAKEIRIGIGTEDIYKNQRYSENISAIGTYDDGHGMNRETLERCLVMGLSVKGEHEKNNEQDSDLGKYGIGLKGATFGFCKRVDIYSWQDGNKPLHTYLDYDEAFDTNSDEVEVPKETNIPDKFQHFVADKLPPSGTLVVWTKLDRIRPRKAPTLLDHLNKDLCRIFRHFMDDDDNLGTRRNITATYFNPQKQGVETKTLRANDPIYLLKPNNTPGYEDEATNELLKNEKKKVQCPKGTEQVIEVITTIAKPQVQKGQAGDQDVGRQPIGKHYGDNLGISIVRAGREIRLSDFGFTIDDPRERWWGIEVRIPPELDQYFGITNNKQDATVFKKFDESEIEAYEEDLENGDENEKNAAEALLFVNRVITTFLQTARDTIRKRGSNTRNKNKKVNVKTLPEVATDIIKDKDRDVETESEKIAAEKTEDQKLKEKIELILREEPELEPEDAERRAKDSLNHIVDIFEDNWPGTTFLDVEFKGQGVVGKINRTHPFYRFFYEPLKDSEDQRAFQALQALLLSYFRAEDTLYNQLGHQQLQKIRNEWGRKAELLIETLTNH
ncbi:MAG: hypothetical protein CMK56_08340 [Proteobacteria bacterium]|nr:hypothetical protein [Pseudomonadota bacterium]